jgi:Lon protease-like protein
MAHIERRRIIQLLTTGAAGLWASHRVHPAFLAAAQDPLLPLFPLDLVLFPHTILPLHIFEERYKEMIKDCLENHWEFGMLAVEGDRVKNIGCTASISRVVERFPDGRLNILVRGERRFEIRDLNQDKSYLRGRPEFQDDEMTEQASEDVRMRAVMLHDRLLELADISTASLQDEFKYTDSQLSYRIMAVVPADLSWKQSLLELRSEPERLDQVVSHLEKLIEYLEKPSDKPSGTPGIALL